MRKNNPERMTIVEQLIVAKNDACEYACKHIAYVRYVYKDPLMQEYKLKEFCKECPLNKIMFKK